MSDKKLEKQKKKLVEAGLMASDDVLIDFFQVSYIDRLIGQIGKWKPGWAYFTEEKLIIITGLLNRNMVIPYKSISALKKCSQFLIPIGISITYEDAEKGKTVTERISMMKRNKWLEVLANKSGATVS